MIDPLLSRLQKVKPRGDRTWVACCPAHDDSDPSLGIQELRDGRILIHCYAGCSPSDVMTAIGLSMRDLFPDGAMGEFKGWEQFKRELQAKRNSPLEQERMILEMADADRRNGKRLSREDLERERQAFMRMRRANTV